MNFRGLMEQGSSSVSFLPGFNLESYPNRDSISYIDQYNIQSVRSILRGTLRYKGFCSNALALVKLGLISLIEHPSLHHQGPDITWRQFMCDLLHLNRDTYYENVKSAILEKLDQNVHQMQAIEELGLLTEELVVKSGNPLDSLAIFMNKRLAYSINPLSFYCIL